MVGQGITVERSAFKERLSNGYGALYFLAYMIDNLWEDEAAQVPLTFDALWGEAVYISVRDIEQYLLGEVPQWDDFLAHRKLYDEEGFYGPKGQMIATPEELKNPVLPLQAEAQ
jgi:hypothetical protein